jgi:hypothetical protein
MCQNSSQFRFSVTLIYSSFTTRQDILILSKQFSTGKLVRALVPAVQTIAKNTHFGA